MAKKMPVVHSSASALSTAGVLTGHGPSSNVSTTSWSVRKSSCLKCWKPNPGPPEVSISTTREMPIALGLPQAGFGGGGATTGFGSGIEPVISAGLSAATGAGLGGGASAAVRWAAVEAEPCIHIAPAVHKVRVPAINNP